MENINLIDLLSVRIAQCDTFSAEINADVNCVLNKEIILLNHRCMIEVDFSDGKGVMTVEILDRDDFDYKEIIEFDDFFSYIENCTEKSVGCTNNKKFVEIYKDVSTEDFQIFTLSPESAEDFDGYLRSFLTIEKFDKDVFIIQYKITWIEGTDDILTNEYDAIILLD